MKKEYIKPEIEHISFQLEEMELCSSSDGEVDDDFNYSESFGDF